ncbi:hypothetical protein FYZ39_01120 [Mobiluncus curtisii]|uniref:RCC1 domain-containing protein n=1 Tax=Mobiluncus curtisii TaxID=2051 RepID=UPI001470476F|nr:hypothetical protein [Mobiluncus curtisii]MCV0020074.1 hypothetical protein [Mobiluncus curtisii]NMW89086.1 hypothetical protein [Mobiluncus curtisii]
MKRLPGLKLGLLSVLAVFVVSGGGLATTATWQDALTLGDARITAASEWTIPLKATEIIDTGRNIVFRQPDGQYLAWEKHDLFNNVAYSSQTPALAAEYDKKYVVFDAADREKTYAGIDQTGKLWTWGNNNYGQLGQGNKDNAYHSAPKQPVPGHLFKTVTVGDGEMLAIDTNGNIWGWGANANYELGVGNADSPIAPIQITSGTKYTKIFKKKGFTYAHATDENGNLWGWGYGCNWGIKHLTESDCNRPVILGKYTDKISNLRANVLLDDAGQVWAQGDSYGGKLCTSENKLDALTPIFTGHTIKSVHLTTNATFALDTNGRLWACGRNDTNNFGTGHDMGKTYTSPTRIIPSMRFAQVFPDSYVFAIDTDNRVLTWGGYQLTNPKVVPLNKNI